MLIKRCCCLRNLKTGAIVSAVWTLLYCIYHLVMSIIRLQDLYTPTRNPKPIQQEFKAKGMLVVWGVMQWSYLIVVFSVIISSVVALVGLMRNSHRMLIAWMVSVLLMLVLDGVWIIVNIVVMEFHVIIIFIIVIWFIGMLIFTYCELCVLSHYHELKFGRGRAEDYNGGRSYPPPNPNSSGSEDSEQSPERTTAHSQSDPNPSELTTTHSQSDPNPSGSETGVLLNGDALSSSENGCKGLHVASSQSTKTVSFKPEPVIVDSRNGADYVQSLDLGRCALHIRADILCTKSEPDIYTDHQSYCRNAFPNQSEDGHFGLSHSLDQNSFSNQSQNGYSGNSQSVNR